MTTIWQEVFVPCPYDTYPCPEPPEDRKQEYCDAGPCHWATEKSYGRFFRALADGLEGLLSGENLNIINKGIRLIKAHDKELAEQIGALANDHNFWLIAVAIRHFRQTGQERDRVRELRSKTMEGLEDTVRVLIGAAERVVDSGRKEELRELDGRQYVLQHTVPAWIFASLEREVNQLPWRRA